MFVWWTWWFFPTKLFFLAPKINIWWYDWSDDLCDIIGFFTVKLWGYKWMWVFEKDFRKYTGQYIWRKIIHHGMSLYSQKDQEKVQFITISWVLLLQHICLGFLYPVVIGIGIYSCSPAFLFFLPCLCRHFYVAIVFPGNSLVFLPFQTSAYTLNLKWFIDDLTCWLVFTQWWFICSLLISWLL